MDQLKAFSLLLVLFFTGAAAYGGQRTFYWTGSGQGESSEICYANARSEGYYKAVDSCVRDHGLREGICQNGYISDEYWVAPYSPYTGACAVRVFITVTY